MLFDRTTGNETPSKPAVLSEGRVESIPEPATPEESGRGSWRLKHGIDLLVGCTALALLSPLLMLVVLAVWLDVGRPVFFRQERVGLAGRRFQLIKFRTLRRDVELAELRTGSRIDTPLPSRFGRFLRRSRLDEMPQFWNVVRGDMSLVGPRPEWTETFAHLDRCIPLYRERLRVRPGLTGWAQVNCGYASSVEDAARKLEYDLYYIEHRSLRLDVEIALRTMWTVVTLRGR